MVEDSWSSYYSNP